MSFNLQNNNSRIILVGTFPPPFHGMSSINSFMHDRLCADGALPKLVNTSPHTLSRSIAARFLKVFNVIYAAVSYCWELCFYAPSVLYIGLSGGNGQFYDLFFIFLARIFGLKIFIHHHSYQYILQKKLISLFLFYIAGKDSEHIVACKKMSCDLRLMYSSVGIVRIISGIATLAPPSDLNVVKKSITTIGFLSNITAEKGILDFLGVAERAQYLATQLKFVLAGPFQDDDIKELVEARMKNLTNVKYIGPVYGEDKISFFSEIDIFLFPTNYINESEGLVIHEAMRSSVPVIAYQRGCIEQIINESNGLSIPSQFNFVDCAYRQILEWTNHPDRYQKISAGAFNSFENNYVMNILEIDRLNKDIIRMGNS